MATNKQLQEWLKRWPDEAVIKVYTASKISGSYYDYTNVYQEELQLPDILPKDMKWCVEYDNIELDFKPDYEKPENNVVTEITFGKHDG